MVTKEMGYQELKQDDIILVSFDPTKGHEQRGYRPCIVLTRKISYLNYMYGVTAKAKRFPLQIPLPKKLTTKGEVLFENHRMIDLETREFKFVEKIQRN